MSKRNWVSHAPIGVGLVVALGLIGAAQHNHSHNTQAANQASSKQYTNGLERFPKPAVVAIKKQSPVADPDPGRQEWREEQDLQAQWQMAYWALGVLIATGLSVVVTAVGVVYVKRTLDLNRELLREAVEATAVHKEIGRALVRAYLTIASVHIVLQERNPVVFFKVYNNGNSPAFDVELHGCFGYRVPPSPLPNVDESKGVDRKSVV